MSIGIFACSSSLLPLPYRRFFPAAADDGRDVHTNDNRSGVEGGDKSEMVMLVVVMIMMMMVSVLLAMMKLVMTDILSGYIPFHESVSSHVIPSPSDIL